MAIKRAYLGEDVPITITYEDDTGTAVDPDDTNADAVPDAVINITAPDDTAAVTDAAMTHTAAGSFEYVWDTAIDAAGAGTYTVEVSAEFGGETKISRNTITLQ